MNDITPKEASEILSHYTDLGYGIIIEGDDISKIKQALSLASKSLANGTTITEGDCISRSVAINLLNEAQVEFDEYYKGLGKAKTIIDNAPPVEQSIKVVCRSRNWSTDCTVTSGFEDGYRHGYRKAKEDVAKRIKDQYNEHHELIPYWLSVGDVKGGAE